MNKISWKELVDTFYKHNETKGITSQFEDPKPLTGVVVFKQSSWPNAKEQYSLDSRSYKFSSDNKYFIPEMGGNSIFSRNLDGTDPDVRLDWVLGQWKIDYCYILEQA